MEHIKSFSEFSESAGNQQETQTTDNENSTTDSTTTVEQTTADNAIETEQPVANVDTSVITSESKKIFVIDTKLDDILESMKIICGGDDSFPYTEEVVSVVESGKFNQEHYVVVDEAEELKITKPSLIGNKFYINIGNTPYGFEAKTKEEIEDINKEKNLKLDFLTIQDIAKKFEKMLQFSAGKALTWLKKRTNKVSGSTKE